MELRSLIWKLLKEQLDQNTINLKNKYVGEGKPVSEKDFEKIIEVTKNKFYLVSWITKKVGQGIIKNEDIYKYEEYFDTFEKNKNKGKFRHKDIHLYKTPEDVLDFIEEAIQVKEGDIKFEETVGKDNYVTPGNIQKLEDSGGIKYLGIFDGYQVFQVFKVSEKVWKLYRDILGRCGGKGARIRICTIANYDYFEQYLEDPKGSSYFVLFNLDDPKSPYQLHYETGQFMDKNDSERIKINKLKFFEWVGKRVPRYDIDQKTFPGQIDLPVKGKGFEDEKGRKQGLWKSFDLHRGQPYLEYIANYKNNEKFGDFIKYYPSGEVRKKGKFDVYGDYIGDYVAYSKDGKIEEKGTFNDRGLRMGLWITSDSEGVNRHIDYDANPVEITGLTKNGLVRYVSYLRSGYNSEEPYGNTVFFNRSGSVAAIGKRGVGGKQLGDWQYFFPDGSIKSEGKFLNSKRSGEWTDVVKTDKGKMIFVADFVDGTPYGKIKVYDDKGVFVKKVGVNKIKPQYWWTMMNPRLDRF